MAMAAASWALVSAFPRGGASSGSRSLGKCVAMSSSSPRPKDLTTKVEESIKSAQETCQGDKDSDECVAAWDEVEELSAAAADRRQRALSLAIDPLEEYCKDHPEADECRIYED